MRSKALACNCLIPGIAVLYPVEATDIRLFRLLSGVSVAPPLGEFITRSVESYRLCVSNCERSINIKTRQLSPELGCCATENYRLISKLLEIKL